MTRYVALVIVLMSIPLAAQQPAPPNAPTAPRAPAVPAAPKPPSVPVAPEPPAPPCFAGMPNCDGGQPVNIRLDVSVTDQTMNGAAQPKTLMVILADRGLGQTRAAFEDRSISVDARPTIVDGLIRVSVTVKSQEPPTGPLLVGVDKPKAPDPLLNWTNSFSLLLQSGKPMVAMETSDAVTKRKMSIEVKATIQK
jgi:hypothetical protein